MPDKLTREQQLLCTLSQVKNSLESAMIDLNEVKTTVEDSIEELRLQLPDD